MFEHIESYPGDPILSLMDAYDLDPREKKVNLSVGFYYDELGKVPVLESVKAAKAQLNALSFVPDVYLPMEGHSVFRSAVQEYLFGHLPINTMSRIATIQTIGGSGALRIGADFLKRYFPGAQVWVSNPTWDNHLAIFSSAGFKVNRYPYLDACDNKIDFTAMLETLETLPPSSIVLLHACCHNPTGLDLTPSQWDTLFLLFSERSLIPFLDAAYLGMGEGVHKDAYSIRALAGSGLAGFVSNSFSKTFSLYGERIGSLSVVCSSTATAERVAGQLKATARTAYSSPPRRGAELVSIILTNPTLLDAWNGEVHEMRQRMIKMRHALYREIKSINPHLDVEYLIQQKGMFSFTGLSAESVDRIRQRFGVYLIRNGRLCIAGLNFSNIKIVAEAITGEH